MCKCLSACSKAGYPSPSNLSEFLLCSMNIRLFSIYIISLDSFYPCFLLLLIVCSSETAMLPLSASLYIIESFHPLRGEQHSGEVHSNLPRCIPMPNISPLHYNAIPCFLLFQQDAFRRQGTCI